MAELKRCPFDNRNCMCQFCEKQCNNGLNCFDCENSGKIEHSVYLCTGFADYGPKGKCMKSFETMCADDFCSYGERKDGKDG